MGQSRIDHVIWFSKIEYLIVECLIVVMAPAINNCQHLIVTATSSAIAQSHCRPSKESDRRGSNENVIFYSFGSR